LSTTLTAWGRGWGAAIDSKTTGAYLLDRANGATMLTIPLGHTLAAFRDVLGDFADVSSVLATRRKSVLALDTGETLPMTASDQVLVSGVLKSGAPVSIHYRGGGARGGVGLVWEINGTEGDIRVTGPWGHAQMVQLSLEGGRGEERELRPLEVPSSWRAGWPEAPAIGNVARVYARLAADLREGTRTAPSFDDAVAVHRIIAAIEDSSTQGRRVAIQ
jgi:predicted dehydrogenase